MKSNKQTNIVVAAIFLVAILVFGLIYNTSVSRVLTDVMTAGRLNLAANVKSLTTELENNNPEKWKDITDKYDNIKIIILDGDGNCIIGEDNVEHSLLDIRSTTIIEYDANTYVLKTYQPLTDRIGGNAYLLIAIDIAIFALLVIFASVGIYGITLWPFRRIYKSIEEYDATGQLRPIKIRGFTGKLYERFCRLVANQSLETDRQKLIMSSISHDIKTPLTAVIGYSQRLKSANLSPEKKEKYVDIICEKAKEISSIVDSFDEYLDYRLKSSFNPVVMTLEELGEFLVETYTFDLDNSGVKFNVNVKNGKKHVQLDINNMRRVFSNIISNSLKHFDKDEKIIEVSVFSFDEKIVLEFEDNGEGVPRDMLEIIFEPLYTSDKGRKVAGLGLAICKEIVTHHGGRIYAGKSKYSGLKTSIILKEYTE